MNSRTLMLAWFVVSTIWIGAVALSGVGAWPAVPLDMSTADPQVRAVYDKAVASYAAQWALTALGPPLVLLVAGWLGFRLKRWK